MSKYACLWSGGKDSCYACYQALQSGVVVATLLNFVGEDRLSRSHGLPAALVACQAELVGLPVEQPVVGRGGYETVFKDTVRRLKVSHGITGLVAGDLELQEHRDWLERVCYEAGVELLLPLWRKDPRIFLEDFIAAGFKAVIVSVRADLPGAKWLGEELTGSMLDEFRMLQERTGFHPCGESGEYHTFVIDGPLFRRAVTIGKTARILRDGYWFLDILDYR